MPSFPLAIAAAYQGMSQEDLTKALPVFYAHNINLSNKSKHNQDDIHIHMERDGRITPNFIGNYEHFDRHQIGDISQIQSGGSIEADQ